MKTPAFPFNPFVYFTNTSGAHQTMFIAVVAAMVVLIAMDPLEMRINRWHFGNSWPRSRIV